MAKIPQNSSTKTFIYTLSDPFTNEVRYVGKTVKSLKSRLTGHIYTSKKLNNHRCNWIKSLGDKKPIIEELDNCPWIDSQELEIYWISQLKSWGFRLVNLTDGGEGNLGFSLTKERKNKLIKSRQKQIFQYDLEGNFIRSFESIQQAGRFLGYKSTSHISSAALGKKHTAAGYRWCYEHKPFLSELKYKYFISNEQKRNLSKMKSKVIVQYDLNGNFIKEWESAKQACKNLGLNYYTLCRHLNGSKTRNMKNIGNYIWKKKIELE